MAIRIISRLGIVEAVKPRRGWDGKLKRIDSLLAWMYDKGIMNKTDRDRKDVIFHGYYRYYNDGDFPRFLSAKGYNKYMNPETIEEALEQVIEDFIKYILNKYNGKYSKSEFNFDRYIDQLDSVIRYTDREEVDPYSINFWFSQLKNPDEELKKWNDELSLLYKKYEAEAEKFAKENPEVLEVLKKNYIQNINNYGLPYIKDILGNLWPDKLEAYKSKMDAIAKKMNNKLLKVKEAAIKLKKEGAL